MIGIFNLARPLLFLMEMKQNPGSPSPIRPEASSLTETQTETRTSLEWMTPWRVIVWDDPVNLMAYVVFIFRSLFGFSPSQAEKLMLEVHTKGKAVVWTGPQEQAEMYLTRLHCAQLKATLERESPPHSS